MNEERCTSLIEWEINLGLWNQCQSGLIFQGEVFNSTETLPEGYSGTFQRKILNETFLLYLYFIELFCSHSFANCYLANVIKTLKVR